MRNVLEQFKKLLVYNDLSQVLINSCLDIDLAAIVLFDSKTKVFCNSLNLLKVLLVLNQIK